MSEGGAPDGAVMRPEEPVEEIAGAGRPRVVHIADARLEGPEGATAAIALDAVARQLAPHAATFFSVDADGELSRSIVHGGGGAPRVTVAEVASWKRELRELDPLHPRLLAASRQRVVTLDDVGGIDAAIVRRPLVAEAYRRLAVVNDVRLPVRADGRLVGGITLWRPLRSRGWSPRQLAVLDVLQPLAEQAFAEAASGAAVDGRFAAGLTDREREVARLIAGGATNAEIARALHIGLETVKSHTRAILLKLGARSRHDVMRQLAAGPRPATDVDGAARTAAQDAETAARLLRALLRWSRERIDGVAGGYAALSGRGDVVGGEVALAAAPAGRAGERADALHEALLTPPFLARLTRDAARWDVVAAAALDPRAERLERLAAAAGWNAPLVMVVRLHGRAAGLVWFARAARSAARRHRRSRSCARCSRWSRPPRRRCCDARAGACRPLPPTSAPASPRASGRSRG